jgi:hypothetical protein
MMLQDCWRCFAQHFLTVNPRAHRLAGLMKESPRRSSRREASRTPAAEEGQDAEPASDQAGLPRFPRLGGGESEGDVVEELFDGTKIYRKDVPPSSFSP